MRVAVFSDSYAPYVSGVVRCIELTREELAARGHAVAVFAPAYPDGALSAAEPAAAGRRDEGVGGWLGRLRAVPWPEEGSVYRFPSIRAPRYPQFRIAVPWGPRLDAALSDFRPDVVHLHSPFLLGRLGLASARRLGVPVCLTVHTQYDIYLRHYTGAAARGLRPLLLGLLRRFCDACDLVLAPTGRVRARLRELGVGGRVEVVPGGVPLEHFRSGGREAFRHELGLEPSRQVLLYVGRLSSEKNLQLLLSAYRMVVAAREDVALVLVGDGPLRPALRREAERAPLAGRLFLPGVLGYQRLPDAHAAAEVFVFPSQSETQGLAVVEAMAAGLPVVAVRSPEVEEVLAGAGLVVAPDARALADALLQVLGRPEWRRRLARRARARSRRYSLATVTDRLLELYAELSLSGRPGA